MATKDLVWQVWPVEEVIVTDPFGSPRDGGLKHRGVDLGPWPGTNTHIIYAPADGTVVEFLNTWDASINDKTFGIGVCLDHLDTPYYSLFSHLKVAYVKVGDRVKAGQAIGEMGWTGKVEPSGPAGKHTHWQVCKSKDFPTDIAQSADPMSFPFAFNTPTQAPGGVDGLTVAQVEAIVVRILEARGLEANFAPVVTRRLALMSEAANLLKVP